MEDAKTNEVEDPENAERSQKRDTILHKQRQRMAHEEYEKGCRETDGQIKDDDAPIGEGAAAKVPIKHSKSWCHGVIVTLRNLSINASKSPDNLKICFLSIAILQRIIKSNKSVSRNFSRLCAKASEIPTVFCI